MAQDKTASPTATRLKKSLKFYMVQGKGSLAEVDFRGWVAAEMSAGDLEYLKRVSKEMDDLLVNG